MLRGDDAAFPSRRVSRAFMATALTAPPAAPDLRDALRRVWFGSALYPLFLRTRPPGAFFAVAPDPWPGDPARADTLLAGHFATHGRSGPIEGDPWRRAEADPLWLAELNKFEWLRDLRDAGQPLAANMAAAKVDEWIAANPRWSPIAWRADVLSSRVVMWIRHYDFLASGATEGFAARLVASLAQQRRHLERLIPGGLAGTRLLAAMKAAVIVDLAFIRAGPAHERALERSLARLSRALARIVLDDGTIAERSPRQQFIALRHLIDLRASLLSADRTGPPTLQAAIERASGMLRFFRHGDGGLACFNGSDEGDPALLDLALARTGTTARPPKEAPRGGFQRLAAGAAQIIADTSAPPGRGLDLEAHAGTLSFEFSIGSERMIVNCGAYPGLASEWRSTMRYTAAHSTAVVDDTNSSEVMPDGPLEHPPSHVAAKRFERDGALWLELSHDGWRSLFGVVHKRRLWLSPDGTDLRGEDTLAGPDGKRVKKTASGRKFAVRFHLHPDVKASLAQSGASALLRLPSGQGWRLRASGGTIGLAESVYLGDGLRIRRAAQLVLTGALGPDGAKIKWAFTRVEG
jgi:uncharacterized heparinase superfamily protein